METSSSSSSSGPRTTAEGGGAQRPTLSSTDAARSRPATSRASLAPAPAPVPSSLPGPPPPPSYRRGKWLEAEHEEVWRLGHTYILASALSHSSSPPSPSPSPSSAASASIIATPSPPPSSSGAGAGSVQDWENLRLHPEGLMKTQARLRSASALRTMFLKMRKESHLQQQQQQQPASTRDGGGGGDARADDLASPPASSSSVPSTFRVRFKSEVFEPSASSRTVRAGGFTTATTIAQSPSATASAAEEEEEATKEDCWTPSEDAVLLAAMITLPNTAAVVASATTPPPPPPPPSSSRLSTTVVAAVAAAAARGQSGIEDQTQKVVVARGNGAESVEENEDGVEEASTPLARAAAWPPTTTTTATDTTTRDPRQQSRIASRSTATATVATETGLTTSAGWLKVREIAERTYRIMEAGTVQEDAGGGGGGGGEGARKTSSRRLRRDAKELENRWRTKWRVDGITKNLAAPEVLLPAIRQQTDLLSKLSVDVLAELGSSSSSQHPGKGGTSAAAAAVADDSSPRSPAPAQTKPTQFAVQEQQEEQPEPSAPITGNVDAETKRSQEDDDPRAAYPTPALGTDALPSQNEDVEYRRDDPGLQGIDEMNELQHSGTTTTRRTPDVLGSAPPPLPGISVPDDAQVQDRRQSTPAVPQAAATADLNKMIGLGLDFIYGVGTGIGKHLQQPHSQSLPPLYNSSVIPTATWTGTEELDPDFGGVRFTTTTTIPLRRASSSAVLSSPSTSPAAVLLPSQSSILSANRAATTFSPFTEIYARPPSSSVDALRRAHQSRPQSQSQPAPFQMYFQPKPRALTPFSVEQPSQQQQQQRFPQQPQPKQQPVSPVHAFQSASMSYKPFSRFSTTPTTTATTDPPLSTSHRDVIMHGSLASSASSSSRGHSFLGTVQEEGLPQPPPNLEQPLYQPSQVRPLLPTTTTATTTSISDSGDDAASDRHHDRGTKRRWSEADLYARSPIYMYETSLGPPQQDATSSWPWSLGTGIAGGPMEQQQQRRQEPNALDRAIAAGRPLADYSRVFDEAGGENDHDEDGRDPFARTHQHAERDKKG